MPSLLLFYLLAADVTLKDLDGRDVSAISQQTTVFLFTRTDCPISNRYAPEVKRIYQEFAPKGVAFYLVYVDPKQQPEAIRAHMREYGYAFSALLDPRHELVKLTHATITPEAAVFAAGRLVYRGRVDDRYIAFGKARQAPSQHDLDDVLRAIIEGRRLEFRETRSVGCFIEDLR